MDRRTFLRAAGLSTLAVAAGTGFTACSSRNDAGPTGSGSGSTTLVLPTYRDAGAAAADLVGAHEGSLPGFFAYPANPSRMYERPVVDDLEITALTYSFSPVVPGLSENEMWQNINETIGAKIDISYTPDADYDSRFATTIAGGDIPDLVAIRPPVQELPAMLEAAFADLTDHLSGDAILDYPSLAAIPTAAWRKAVVQGRIWGLPVPRPPIGPAFFVRKDLLEQRGLPVQPRNFDELADTFRALTDARSNTYASASVIELVGFLANTLNVSNGWSEEGGSFTYWVETDEYEQALAETTGLVEEGVFHPDSIATQNTQRNEWFTNGSAPMIIAGWGGWHSFVNWGKEVAGHEVAAIIPFGHDGGEEAKHALAESSGFTALRKADPERIDQILRVADWLASPFGTQDYLTRKFGIEGVTYDLAGSDPVSNERGSNLRLVPFAYLTDCMGPIYQAGDQAVVQARFDYQEQVLPMIDPDPTDGLYAPAQSAKGAQLEKILEDGRNDVLAGRRPVSQWADVVDEWRSRGGDEIRQQYEDALDAAG
ncbi:extracellular solute-binding protein [Jiangella muralis]|uniref:extracellular solute-binding protein n=1 Tax=Jiangella muralis TaxID=702383 RepID=UPI00069E0141|nr:extracellular solute-binding protein [Jiangella muralis]